MKHPLTRHVYVRCTRPLPHVVDGRNRTNRIGTSRNQKKFAVLTSSGVMAVSVASSSMATGGFLGNEEDPSAGMHTAMDTLPTGLQGSACDEVRESGADESAIMRPPMATINIGNMDTLLVLQSHACLTKIHAHSPPPPIHLIESCYLLCKYIKFFGCVGRCT